MQEGTRTPKGSNSHCANEQQCIRTELVLLIGGLGENSDGRSDNSAMVSRLNIYYLIAVQCDLSTENDAWHLAR